MEQRNLWHNRNGQLLIGGAAALLVAGAVAYGVRHHSGSISEYPITTVTASQNLIQTGQWSYMPGTSIDESGLHVGYRDFRIVEQDGSGGQPNPPVNEYGTHLKVSGPFELSIDLTDVSGSASLQLYAEPPKVSDEFRVEPKSIRLTFAAGRLTLARWDGDGGGNLANQQPIASQTYSYTPDSSIAVTAIDSGGKLAVTINSHAVGSIDDPGTFSSGEIWIGAAADSPAASFTVSRLTAKGLNGNSVAAVDTSAVSPVPKISNGLQELAAKKRPGFLVGSDVALWALVSDPAYHKRLLDGDFGILTPENAMKWQFIEPQPGVFDFHESDAIIAEADKNGIRIHGHPIVFGEALPRWLSTMPTDTPEQKAAVRQALIQYVTTVVGHFKNSVDEWDINEVFADYADDGSFPALFKDNVFYRAIGPNYVPLVAQTIRKVQPQAKIWINEFGLETDTGPRATAVKKQIAAWNISTGVGLQAHIYDTSTDLIVNNQGSAPELAKTIRDFSTVKQEIRISEMDAPLHGDYAGSSQAQQFAGVFTTCLSHPSCVAFSTWSQGPTDIYQNDRHELQPAATDSLFDPNMKPTAAYYAIQRELQK